MNPHRIALLFNANKVYDREIITGIGEYLRSTRVVWDLFLEEDFISRPQEILAWSGDGIIADFDDPDVRAVLKQSKLPVIAVGDMRKDVDRPPGIPYVSTDNGALIQLAYTHLIETGLPRFALYSKPESPYNRWAQAREEAYRALVEGDNLPCEIYRGQATRASDWNEVLAELKDWVRAIPKPIGIIAVNDARARLLMQACLLAGVAVPEEVAIVGIDNDPLTRTLTRIPLTSVIQGTETMGRIAAELLHQSFHGKRMGETHILVPPAGINIQTSSLHQPINCPYVMRARHYIRQYAGQGIKTEQVADYVGISRSSLESYFRRELGHTVHDEILFFRLEMAKKLLLDEKLSSKEIAVRCGFTSLPYMHAVFRRELGCTPKEYQMQHQVSVTD